MSEVTANVIEDEILQKYYKQTILPTGLFNRVQPFDDIVLAPFYPENHPSIQEFEVFEDDVWVTTFPKSGKKFIPIFSIFCMVIHANAHF